MRCCWPIRKRIRIDWRRRWQRWWWLCQIRSHLQDSKSEERDRSLRNERRSERTARFPSSYLDKSLIEEENRHRVRRMDHLNERWTQIESLVFVFTTGYRRSGQEYCSIGKIARHKMLSIWIEIFHDIYLEEENERRRRFVDVQTNKICLMAFVFFYSRSEAKDDETLRW